MAVVKEEKNRDKAKTDFKRFVVRLENMILTGAFKPRERLVEATLASMFEVSRYWVRDAFKILEAKKLLTVIPFKGVMVSELSEREVEETFVIRVALEQLVIRLALEHLTDEHIAEMHRLVEEIEDAQDKRDVVRMVEADTQYHDYIFGVSQNQILKDMIHELRNRLHIIRYSAWSSPDILARARREHRQFIEFMKERNLDGLMKLAEEHISHAKDFYLFQLRAESVYRI